MGDQGEEQEDRGRTGFTRRRFLQGAAIGTGIAAADMALFPLSVPGASNPVVTENAKPGSPPADWDVEEHESIEGFATDCSVNAGAVVQFKIRTESTSYRIDIYRMGWYAGNGARKVATVNPSVPLPQNQPDPITDPSGTGIVDCGNWAVSASWTVPATAVSGVYFANLIRLDGGQTNRIMFVVRNDGRAADVMYQTADTTYQAYNRWGGNSLYAGTAAWGRATKVSYNRPMEPPKPEDSFFYAEYPLVRWLERCGYNVVYSTGVDTDRAGTQLLGKKVFISSGHDEYWSGPQRANVEAARNSGVGLAFLSGNEVFWKVRWEPSIDGSGTPRRTMVCYKETLAGAKIDPSPEWTGTWRDPRFSPPSNGGRPENQLTGQLFVAMTPREATDFAIKVPYAYSRFRQWRNTNVTQLQPGQTTSMAAQTLGYEFDADSDNGVRPPGLIRVSQTTVTAQDVLQDHGAVYAPGPVTHYMTLYRAPSGALVWGTGTIQWSWGLDSYHLLNPGPAPAPILRMQQFTVNILADMGAQPATPHSGLFAAAKSTDALPPTTVISSPAAGATVPVGSTVTVTGTATDSGGGQVAAIEVSTDGGTRWRPATGAGSWSDTFVPLQLGPVTIKARGVDDSCNLESPGATRTITAGPRPTPCSIWPSGTLPKVADVADGVPLELGVRFRASTNGFITAIKFYKGTPNTGTHVGNLWTNTGSLLGTATFTGETASGWQTATFAQPIAVSAGVTYVASYFSPNGHYARDANYFATAFDLPPLRALANGEDGANGVFRAGSSGFPNQTFGANNYWVDVVFDIDDHRVPTVVDRSPAPGIEAVALNTSVVTTFSEFMNGSTIVFELRNAANALVPGSLIYDNPTRRATFTPTAPLAARQTYTARVVSAKDASGSALAAPVSWTFTTTTAPGNVPTSIWDSSAVPAVAANNDPAAIEVGVKFRSDLDGAITAIRFYKGASNGGTHVGHLWKADGTLLGTVTFAAESGSGWQQANFPAPILVERNIVYIASYVAPAGNYAISNGYFSANVDRGPLHALANGVAGGNGVYRYGGGFPSDTFNGSNYWIDVMFAVPPDTAGPVVVDRAPAPGLLGVATATAVTAQFNEAINPASLAFTLRAPGNVVVPSTTTYDAPTRVATLTPSSALAQNTTYTASVSAADTLGNAMPAPATWTFTTTTAVGQLPATIWDSNARPAVASDPDPSAIEVGMKFRADVAGVVSAIRFFKGAGNTGTHIGRLWSATGTLLGSVAFANETATGWQQASFSQPIAVSAGTTYVVSYHAPNGRFSKTAGGLAASVDRAPLHALGDGVDGGNGVYLYGAGGFPSNSGGGSNYWIDLVFTDAVAPTVVDRTPAPGATGVPRAVRPTATFSEPVQPTTIFFQLRDSFGSIIASTVAYDATTKTATLIPNSQLLPLSTYTATVSGARDPVGNAMAAPVSWSFRTSL